MSDRGPPETKVTHPSLGPRAGSARLLSHCTALHSLASVFISGKSFSRIFFFGFTSSRGGPGKLQAGAKE